MAAGQRGRALGCAVGCAVGCAILAAGAGRRFGGPKQLAPIDGVPLLRRAAEAACASACDGVAVVLGAGRDQLGSLIDGLPVDRLDNPRWQSGMASSIRLATSWARRRGWAALLIAVADQPRLRPAHLDALIAAYSRGRTMAASLYAGVRGVPAIFPAHCYSELEELVGDTGARALLRNPNRPVACVAWPDGARDVDLRADLEE